MVKYQPYIYDKETNEVVEKLKLQGNLRTAQRIMRGASINLDHARYGVALKRVAKEDEEHAVLL